MDYHTGGKIGQIEQNFSLFSGHNYTGGKLNKFLIIFFNLREKGPKVMGRQNDTVQGQWDLTN